MNFKHTLPDHLVDKVSNLEQFTNGGTQVTVRLKNGDVFQEVLISNSTWITAMRGYTDLPFGLDDIADIYQMEDDKNPKERGGWHYWDKWEA